MSHIFEEAGVDPIKGTEIMGILDLSIDDLNMPQRYAKFRQVVEFMQGFSDYRYILNKITMGKQVDKLEHSWAYMCLTKEHLSQKEKLSEAEKQIDELERYGDEKTLPKLKDLSESYLQIKKSIDSLEQEMNIYEK